MTLTAPDAGFDPLADPPQLIGRGTVRDVECLLFVAGEPLSGASIARQIGIDPETVEEAVRRLRDRYLASDSALQVIEIAGGYQISTQSDLAPIVGRFLAPHANRLSRPALEAATIVAYRQPVTQAEVEAIRGVASDGVLKTLVERELIAEAGRKPTPGRPILYGTTPAFLHYFGLSSLRDLPALDEDESEMTERQEQVHIALEAVGIDDEAAVESETDDSAATGIVTE